MMNDTSIYDEDTLDSEDIEAFLELVTLLGEAVTFIPSQSLVTRKTATCW
jgi:hypothetical protein